MSKLVRKHILSVTALCLAVLLVVGGCAPATPVVSTPSTTTTTVGSGDGTTTTVDGAGNGTTTQKADGTTTTDKNGTTTTDKNGTTTTVTPNTDGTTATPNTNGTTATPNTNGTTATPNTNGTTVTPNTNGTTATPNTNGTTVAPSTNGSTAATTVSTTSTTKKPTSMTTTKKPTTATTTTTTTKKPTTTTTTRKPTTTTTTKKPTTTTTKAPTTTTTKVPVAADGSFFDDFTNGIDQDLWSLVRQAWGGNNNGVKPENVNYTEDGVVVLTANGDHYTGSLGKRSGGCLITNHIVGPGSYEVRMKVLPRLGTCTAMWTYFNDGSRNHEIDIELPGNTSTFKYNLFTNWLTEWNYSSNHTIPDFYHNDGEWHTYRFDWHTDPQRIDYYIDGVKEFSISQKIPTVATYFWLGVWFPQNWCGNPDFETAHMLVDWVRYTAYDEPHEKSTQSFRNKAGVYPTAPIALPTNNYAAGGSFEYTSPAWTLSGGASLAAGNGGQVMQLSSSSATASQVISSVNAGGLYKITADGKASAAGSKAVLKIEYLGSNRSTVLGSTMMEFNSQTMTTKSQNVTLPNGTFFMRITCTGTGSGNFSFDNLYVTQPSRGDF